jgi:hypothetical protein
MISSCFLWIVLRPTGDAVTGGDRARFRLGRHKLGRELDRHRLLDGRVGDAEVAGGGGVEDLLFCRSRSRILLLVFTLDITTVTPTAESAGVGRRPGPLAPGSLRRLVGANFSRQCS